MLPFLKHSQDASMSAPVDVVKRTPDHEEEYDPMHAAADDLIAAVTSKDTKATADALRAAFELADSERHVEGKHTNEEQ